MSTLNPSERPTFGCLFGKGVHSWDDGELDMFEYPRDTTNRQLEGYRTDSCRNCGMKFESYVVYPARIKQAAE